MHVVLERARKAAGISDIKTKNYPKDSHQRGCGYWAAFIGAVGTELAALDQEIKRLQAEKTALAEAKAEKADELQELRKEDVETIKRAGRNGMQAIREREGWSIEKGKEYEAIVIG